MSVVRGLIAAAAIAMLLAPAAEAADITIGSNLAGDATSNICFADCTFVQTSGGTPVAASPVDGTVVRWRLKSSSSGNAPTCGARPLSPSGTGGSTGCSPSFGTLQMPLYPGVK